MDEGELQRILDRAGLDTPPADLHPLAYRDRQGYIHLPLDAVVAVARAFAAAEPQTVVGYLDDEEEELRLKGTSRASAGTTNTFASCLRDMRLLDSGRGFSRKANAAQRDRAVALPRIPSRVRPQGGRAGTRGKPAPSGARGPIPRGSFRAREHHGNTVLPNSRKMRSLAPSPSHRNSPQIRPIPRRLASMVRKGSPVRVRQRASETAW